MVRSVVREHHWPPDKIGGLFVDAIDYEGLEFWYDDLMDVNNKLKEAQSKTNVK
jgi:hypothetical protein